MCACPTRNGAGTHTEEAKPRAPPEEPHTAEDRQYRKGLGQGLLDLDLDFYYPQVFTMTPVSPSLDLNLGWAQGQEEKTSKLFPHGPLPISYYPIHFHFHYPRFT
jgi:hypothetical protein